MNTDPRPPYIVRTLKRFDVWCEDHLGPCDPYASWQVWFPVLSVVIVGIILAVTL